MKNKKWLRSVLLSLLCLTLLLGVYVTPKTMAYLTDRDRTYNNNFSVGNVVVDIVETFNPPAHVQVGTNSFVKKVQLKNSGTVPAYLRANLMFSNEDVMNISQVSGDGGAHWYTFNDFKSHLPSGWAWKSTGVLSGYFYYTSPVQPGGTTPALLTNVKVTFQNKTADTNQTINRTPRDFDIFVYAEGVQQYKLNGSSKHTNYETAWTEFLNNK